MNHCELGLLLQNPRESLKKQSVLGKQENIELRAHGVLILSRPVFTVDSTTIEKVAPLLHHFGWKFCDYIQPLQVWVFLGNNLVPSQPKGRQHF